MGMAQKELTEQWVVSFKVAQVETLALIMPKMHVGNMVEILIRNGFIEVHCHRYEEEVLK